MNAFISGLMPPLMNLVPSLKEYHLLHIQNLSPSGQFPIKEVPVEQKDGSPSKIPGFEVLSIIKKSSAAEQVLLEVKIIND